MLVSRTSRIFFILFLVEQSPASTLAFKVLCFTNTSSKGKSDHHLKVLDQVRCRVVNTLEREPDRLANFGHISCHQEVVAFSVAKRIAGEDTDPLWSS